MFVYASYLKQYLMLLKLNHTNDQKQLYEELLGEHLNIEMTTQRQVLLVFNIFMLDNYKLIKFLHYNVVCCLESLTRNKYHARQFVLTNLFVFVVNRNARFHIIVSKKNLKKEII